MGLRTKGDLWKVTRFRLIFSWFSSSTVLPCSLMLLSAFGSGLTSSQLFFFYCSSSFLFHITVIYSLNAITTASEVFLWKLFPGTKEVGREGKREVGTPNSLLSRPYHQTSRSSVLPCTLLGSQEKGYWRGSQNENENAVWDRRWRGNTKSSISCWGDR